MKLEISEAQLATILHALIEAKESGDGLVTKDSMIKVHQHLMQQGVALLFGEKS